MNLVSRIAASLALIMVLTSPAYAQLDFGPNDPSASGIEPALLADLSAAISNGTFTEVHSLLIVRDGKVVHESYYPGNTDHFDDNLNRLSPGDTLWDASMPHYVASVTKSMTSAVVGIALAEYGVRVDSTVRELLPAYRNHFFGLWETGITVENLLTMTGGHDWDEWGSNDLTQMWRSGQDFIQFALAPSMAHQGGTFWRYNSGEANLLMGIVDALSGNAASYIQDRLFDPLAISEYDWRTQPGGLPEAAARLFMRPRDMAKMGELYLNRGEWDGQQVIPSAWVDSSLSVQVSTRPLTEWDYGYLWWAKTINYTQDGVSRTQQYYAAEGDGGNLIAVFPDLDLAVIITQGNYSDFGTYDRQNKSILANYVLPATMGTATDNVTPPDGARLDDLLLEVYPNPSGVGATMAFSLPAPGRVMVTLYDVLGRQVAVLADGHRTQGRHQVTPANLELPPGTYFVRLVQDSASPTQAVATWIRR